MTASPLTPKPRRYYGDDCQVDKDLDLSKMKQLLHAAFTHWVARNWHQRDFQCAVEHCATMAYLGFAMEGRPTLVGEMPPAPVIALASPRKTPAGEPARRLYDELNALSPEIDLSMLDQALAWLFVKWLQDGWHARDFIQAAKDCASVLCYDYDLCCSLGGLGGGRTGVQFLSEAYHG